MEPLFKEISHFLNASQPHMIEQLHHFCEINSGSYHLQGLEKIALALHQAFQPIADTIEAIAFPDITTVSMQGHVIQQSCGQALLIRKRPHLDRRVLLCGHMDTVFAPDHPFQSLRYLDENCINGPGVSDMKGGLITLLHALTAFEQTPNADSMGWDIFINADEEIGSPASSQMLKEMAKQYAVGLVYEPAMTPTGVLAKNRKGSGKLTLIANGKSAHAGRAFYEGRNAICYLADIISEVHLLNGQREGVTINIGLISGGDALNVVPDKAVAKLDIRIALPEDEYWVQDKLSQIAKKHQKSDYSLEIQGSFSRPVKRVNQATQSLFTKIQQLGHEMGLDLNWKDNGGCCDGNNLAQYGMAVIDTLGVRGGAIHSAEEFILLDSLVERSVLSALLLTHLAKGDLETICPNR